MKYCKVGRRIKQIKRGMIGRIKGIKGLIMLD